MTRSPRSVLSAVLLLASAMGAQAQTAAAGGCTFLTLPGEVVCVCHDPAEPPTDPRGAVLLLDGRPAGEAVGSVPGVSFFRLPAETPLGEHTVSVGSGPLCTVEVIRIVAQLDREKIWRGQGTPLRIEIDGTRGPVRLRLTNETPGGVTLEGGADQDVSTSGGGHNTIERRVRGVSPGDFDIRYELLDAACPCGEFPGEGVFEEGEIGRPPTEPLPRPVPPITAPPPERPRRPPPEGCASIGEEIEQMKERYTGLTEEITHDPSPQTTVVTPGPTGHEYCDRTYTTWARGAQAISIHRLMTQIRDLADFCLGHGTCTPEGHRAYLDDLASFAATVQADSGFVSVAREMPALTDSLIREYRYELDQLRQARRELETTTPARDAEAYRPREAAGQVRSVERSLEQMELWRGWSRELVTALDRGSLLAPTPTRRAQETSP